MSVRRSVGAPVARRSGRLAAAMRLVAQRVGDATEAGDWSAFDAGGCRLEIDGDDEFGDSVAAFNELVAELERSRDVAAAAGELSRALIDSQVDLSRPAQLALERFQAASGARVNASLGSAQSLADGSVSQRAADMPRNRSTDLGEDELLSRFTDALREGDAKVAEGVAEDALQNGFDVAAVHARLIAPAMNEIGKLWEHDVISVGEEHLATAISHGVAARIFGRGLRASPRSRERVMLAAVQGEHHILGLRLAADVLECAGYDVLFLGADVPLPALLTACRIHQPAVLGLAVSMWLNVPTLIWELEKIAELEDPPAIMIGGRAIGPVLIDGLRAPVITSTEQVLDAVASLIAAPRVRGVVDPGLSSRISLAAPISDESAIHPKETIPASFAATSLAVADSMRESARQAYVLQQLADRDGLTGLYNRRAFDERFLEMSALTEQESVMLMIDVDKFKTINDSHGHETGDAMLIAVASAILEEIRGVDVAARFGGDEFVVLLAGTDVTAGAAIAERIRARVLSAQLSPPVTLSIGAAAFSANPRLTSQAADRALYQAKESGRNCVRTSTEAE